MSYRSDMSDEDLRFRWVAYYKHPKVLAAILKKIAYRKERVAFWESNLATAEEKLLMEGVEIRKSFDQFGNAGVTYTNNVGANVQVVVDPNMQRAITEATQKLHEHRKALTEMEGWRDYVESLDPKLDLALTYKDYTFFFGDR